MENLQGRHFSITDPKDVKTVIYEINKTEKDKINKIINPKTIFRKTIYNT